MPADPATSTDSATDTAASTGTASSTDTDPALAREQAHLRLARAELARMRGQTLSLQVQGGDRVSSEYLAATLHRRAVSLVDDPATALFFGRTDAVDGQRWYIGRRHVSDSAGDPVVVDWRAEVSRAFYRASRAEPMGLTRRRRFGIESGAITAYEDEELAGGVSDVHVHDGQVHAGRLSPGSILTREIERPRVGPMRDIVATIQPEQDEIVRADAGTTVCVQGAPGTGKTAVGLHRAAWLLYAFRDRLARSGVLVIGPNRAFLEHVGAVLPALGEVEVRHTTADELVARVPVRGTDPADVAALKGDARMAEVLRRAVWSHVTAPVEGLALPRGSRTWRVPAYELAEIVEELRTRGVRYGAARAMLAYRLAHAVLLRMEAAGDSPDDRVQDAVARSREVRATVKALWPALDPVRVVWRLLGDDELLARCSADLLSDAERQLLHWEKPPRGPGTVRWSTADSVLIDEVADLLDRTTSLGHVVLDEAQDLSPMQLRAVGRRCSTGSATVLGDLAQGTTPWATSSWAETLLHLGKPGSHVEELTRGFRVPGAVIDFATRLLPLIAPGLEPPRSVRQDPGYLDLHAVSDATELWPASLVSVRAALGHQGSVGVVVPDVWLDKAVDELRAARLPHHVLGGSDGHPEALRLAVVPATVAKGLEFDRVVVVEPAAIAEAEPDERSGLRRLYVVLTRAVTGLAVVHARPLPPCLQAT